MSQQQTGIDSPATSIESDPRSRWDGPYVIDKNGKTVLALRSIWERLDRLTIVLSAEGENGLPAFTEYVVEQLLKGVEPERTWWLDLEKREKEKWTGELTESWTFRFRVDRSRN